MGNFVNDVHIINPQIVTFNGNVNDFLITSTILRATPTLPMNLSGITMGTNGVHDGAILFLINASTNVLNTITILHNSNLSLLANRVLTSTGAPIVVNSLAPIRMIYDTNPARQGWWVI